jgi:hypothetical protein
MLGFLNKITKEYRMDMIPLKAPLFIIVLVKGKTSICKYGKDLQIFRKCFIIRCL